MNGNDLKLDYSKYTAWLKCPKCENGKVQYIHTERGPINEIEVKPCDKCKKSFGIKACEKMDLLATVTG